MFYDKIKKKRLKKYLVCNWYLINIIEWMNELYAFHTTEQRMIFFLVDP